MEMTTIGAAIYKDIEQNEYLNKLYDNLLFNYGLQLFGLIDVKARELNVRDLLRFADILSKSVDAEKAEQHKLMAQEIVALLHALDPEDERIRYYLGSVLTNVTNFRGMNIKAADYRSSELYERLFTQFSQDYLRIPAAPDKYFFKAQKEIYDKFSAKFLSYSAPTSLGKSYVMRMYIKEKIEKYGDGNFTIVVPTKALINEVTANITEDLGNILYEKNYRIVTSAGAVALEEEHNFIFVMTPERLLYLLILLPDMPMEYLFVDEAHKISQRDDRSAYYYKIVDMLAKRDHAPHIIFASPNIPNPDIYLQLVTEKGEGESFTLATRFSPVNQEKFLIDCKGHDLYSYNESTQKLTKLSSFDPNKELLDFVREIGEGKRNIIYSNNKDRVIEYALAYADPLDPLPDLELQQLAEDIRNEVHSYYYLADIITKGVAYHMGYLPATIRVRIELLYKKGSIKTLFCTSTLLEGVNLPADNLFITSHKNGGDMGPVDFRNLMGRVGRIEFNLYGNVFLVAIKWRTNKERFLSLLKEEIEPQKLSLVTALSDEQKEKIVRTLESGNTELLKEPDQSPNEYSLIRKFSNILLKDIVNERQSRVRKEFAEYLKPEVEKKIVERFRDTENPMDEDITLSVDQTEKLQDRIRAGLHYPSIHIGGKANYTELYNFLVELCEIFKWETYEMDTLGYRNKESNDLTRLKHYAFVLNQWVSGMPIERMVADQIVQNEEINRLHEEDPIRNKKQALVKYQGHYVVFEKTPEHVNALIGNMLEDIEDIILFRISNYFLRFSKEYRAVHPDEAFMDWYEFVEYGSTDPTAIWIQRNGFTREAATYMTAKGRDYVIRTKDGKLRIRGELLETENQSIRREAEQIRYNSPEIFVYQQ